MAKKGKEQDNEVFFAQIAEPDDVRREILESLKDILETLQRFEKFKQKRHEKLEKIHHLRKLVKETYKLTGILRLKLPQANLKSFVKEAPKPARKKEKKKEETPVKSSKKTELDRLEDELSAIEGKLKSFT